MSQTSKPAPGLELYDGACSLMLISKYFTHESIQSLLSILKNAKLLKKGDENKDHQGKEFKPEEKERNGL